MLVIFIYIMDLINTRKMGHVKKIICLEYVTALAPLLRYVQYFKLVSNSDAKHLGAWRNALC